jgi:hypothetical protein
MELTLRMGVSARQDQQGRVGHELRDTRGMIWPLTSLLDVCSSSVHVSPDMHSLPCLAGHALGHGGR